MTSLRRCFRWTSLLLSGAVVASCDGAPESPVGDGLRTVLQLSAGFPYATAAGDAEAYDAADRVWIRLTAPGSAPAFEDVQPFDPSGAETSVPVELTLSRETTFLLEVELRRSQDPLFRGSSEVTLAPGLTAQAEVGLEPVGAGVQLSEPGGPLRSIGETVPLEGVVLFATGDVAGSLSVEWTSLDPAVAAVVMVGGMPFASAVGDGQARLQGSFGAFADVVTVTVHLEVVAVDVQPPSSTISVGGSLQLTATATDARGNVIPGRSASWSSDDPSVASVDGDGLVRGMRPGTVEITAAVDGEEGTAIVEVVPAAPGVETFEAVGVGATVAELRGSVNPNGAETTTWFEWATNASLAGSSTTEPVPVGSGSAGVEVAAPLEELSPATQYWFRAVAVNEVGTTRGEIRSFTTEALPPPSVATGSATSVGSTGATLHGTVNPNGGATTAWFEWATNASLDGFSTTEPVSVGSGTAGLEVDAELMELSPGTRYWFRAVAMNEGGTRRGEIRSFDTGMLEPPTALTGPATAVGLRSAILQGTVNPNGAATSAWFEWGTDPSLSGSSSTAPEPVGAGTTDVDVHASLTGLSMGTRYYFRVVAMNEAGTSRGEILSFDTGELTAPSVLTQAATAIQTNGATLNGLVNPNGSGTLAWFEWGTDPSLSAFSSTNLVSVGAGSTSVATGADLTTLKPESTYWFRVAATNAAGTSRGSILSFVTALPAPSGLVLDRAGGTVYLNWQDNSATETSFRIERSTSSPTSGFIVIGSAGKNATAFQDNGPLPAGAVYYRVRACNAQGCSAPSNVAAVVIPAAVIGGTVQACSAACFALVGYQVSLSGPVTLATTTNASGQYQFSGLPGGTYTVSVQDAPCDPAIVFSNNSQVVSVSPGSVATVNFVGTLIVCTPGGSGGGSSPSSGGGASGGAGQAQPAWAPQRGR